LGLEVSPRKSRECSTFWGELVSLGADSVTGIQLRDHRWEDSALLPTLKDLADPSGFIKSTTVPDDLSGLL
jgi:uncharacterized protein (DUF2342 family)